MVGRSLRSRTGSFGSTTAAARRGKQEGPLHPHAMGDAANLEGAVEALRAMQSDHHAFEDLDPFFTALDHFDVHAYGISDLNRRAAFALTFQYLVQFGHLVLP